MSTLLPPPKEIAQMPVDWIEERSGLVSFHKYMLFRNVPKDISWLQTLGSALITVFILQATTGILLAIARISGETAPLLFTALNNQFFSTNMNAPMPSLPVVIFQFALSPYEEWQKLAWTGALLITVTVLALSILARSLAARKS